VHDGCTLEITTPQNTVFVSTSDASTCRASVSWYPGTVPSAIEDTISKATGISKPLDVRAEDGSLLVLASTIPHKTHLIVQVPKTKPPLTRPSVLSPTACSRNRSLSRGRSPTKFRPVARSNSRSTTRSTTTPAATPTYSRSLSRETMTRHRIRDSSANSRASRRSISPSCATRDSRNLNDYTNDEYCVHKLQGHSGAVLCMCIVGDVLFSGSQDHTIMIGEIDSHCTFSMLPLVTSRTKTHRKYWDTSAKQHPVGISYAYSARSEHPIEKPIGQIY